MGISVITFVKGGYIHLHKNFLKDSTLMNGAFIMIV